MQTEPNESLGDPPWLVRMAIGLDPSGLPLEGIHDGEIHSMLREVDSPFGFVPLIFG